MMFFVLLMPLIGYSMAEDLALQKPVSEGLSALREKQAAALKVLTFNIWVDGGNVADGFAKVAKHIRLVDADIVFLQEVQRNTSFYSLLDLLNGTYTGVYRNGNYPDTVILCKAAFKIYPETMVQTEYSVSVKVLDPHTQRNLSLWSVHLQWRSYGPYAACMKQTTDFTQILAGEFGMGYDMSLYPGRIQNMRALMQLPTFKMALINAEMEPMILGGDFNCPSHLDWTAQSKALHCGWEFAWPATRFLVKAGMTDSFRDVHPDPVKEPGNTWSSVQAFTGPDWGYTVTEPQDRIDMIFYRGSHLLPLASQTYEGSELVRHKPFHHDNDYPSDHRAVITEFAIRY